ncbi:uncharacterized protein LOC106669845 isoform X3 [Cimex lectularius]|uniref:DUF4485 domain-containing protein n=1 Tax=Cimex lectularius TaxID=79782 RepID=A0A8I6S8D7_CIMLE|nr:uncharacterized protein LOC106669845 isoform X3 [Cimex lectularius]
MSKSPVGKVQKTKTTNEPSQDTEERRPQKPRSAEYKGKVPSDTPKTPKTPPGKIPSDILKTPKTPPEKVPSDTPKIPKTPQEKTLSEPRYPKPRPISKEKVASGTPKTPKSQGKSVLQTRSPRPRPPSAEKVASDTPKPKGYIPVNDLEEWHSDAEQPVSEPHYSTEKPKSPEKVPSDAPKTPKPQQGLVENTEQPFLPTSTDKPISPEDDQSKKGKESKDKLALKKSKSPSPKKLLLEECPTGDGPIGSLHTEFMYYSSVLKEVTPTLTNFATKQRIFEWIDKLYQAAYFTSPLILKRNLYLVQLVLTSINNELYGVFVHSPPPPEAALPPVDAWCPGKIPTARWEKITFWDDLFTAATEEIYDSESYILKCYYHGNECNGNNDEPPNEKAAGELLDQEFKFFLYIIQPYLTFITDPRIKLNVALWLQHLSRIQTCSCTVMKGIRNDYMQALIGYVQDIRLVGPFQNLPEEDVLIPLAEAAEKLTENAKPIGTPLGREADNFLSMQPQPKNGAFCYVAVSGQLQQMDYPTAPENKDSKLETQKKLSTAF